MKAKFYLFCLWAIIVFLPYYLQVPKEKLFTWNERAVMDTLRVIIGFSLYLFISHITRPKKETVIYGYKKEKTGTSWPMIILTLLLTLRACAELSK